MSLECEIIPCKLISGKDCEKYNKNGCYYKKAMPAKEGGR